ncbi:MAG TPA: class IV adenylate cyclase [Pelolinea sp.]|nr:class IV adenylate cyclase [Pelolinea sp.]
MGSKLEQEVKFYLNNLKALEEKLISLGAALKQPRTHEVNLRFDTPDRRLSGTFQVLRLRKDEKIRLTYKGASDPTREVSAREELEVEVSDFATAQAILESLGYEVMVMYEKFRSAFFLDGVEISLDEMPLGNFCEIEGADTHSIQQCAERLGLDWELRSKLSYLALFNIARQSLNLEATNLSFEAFEGVNLTSEDIGLVPAN